MQCTPIGKEMYAWDAPHMHTMPKHNFNEVNVVSSCVLECAYVINPHLVDGYGHGMGVFVLM